MQQRGRGSGAAQAGHRVTSTEKEAAGATLSLEQSPGWHVLNSPDYCRSLPSLSRVLEETSFFPSLHLCFCLHPEQTARPGRMQPRLVLTLLLPFPFPSPSSLPTQPAAHGRPLASSENE